VFLFHNPTQAEINAFIRQQHGAQLSYKQVGKTRNGSAPFGFARDHNRIQLGHGEQVFEKALLALEQWEMFKVPNVRLYCPIDWSRSSPSKYRLFEPGTIVAVVAKHLNCYSLNAACIVYRMYETAERVRRFGFAYGTLPDHVECGEERFLIEWDRSDDSVFYDLFAFSRPQHPLVALARPFARHLQKEFARESKQAMLRAVQI